LRETEAIYEVARRHHISVIVGSFNQGPKTSYPASSPSVTSVGGTKLFFGNVSAADPNGTYQRETVWNEATGTSVGGVRRLLSRPQYQSDYLPKPKLKLLGCNRGYPDVAWSAANPDGGVLVRTKLANPDGVVLRLGGTSAAAAQWAGLTAVMNQAANHPLGFLNPRLYRLAGRGGHDIIIGDNFFGGVGYNATPGWDLTTGWGTPDEGLLWKLILDGRVL